MIRPTAIRAFEGELADVKGRAWNTGNKAQRWLPGTSEPTTEIVDRTRWEIAT